jgi:hypothetical protein
MDKKSQLSMFIIAGILVLLIAAVAIYMAVEKKRSEAEGVINLPNTPAYATKLFDSYARDCLKASLEDGINLIGEQGSYIYKSQGGIINNGEHKVLERDGKLVTYVILRDPNETDLPLYPCRNDSPKISERAACGYYYEKGKLLPGDATFGIIDIAPLENGNDSIKKQLEDYTTRKTRECITSLEKEQFKFNMNNISVSLHIGEEDVDAKMNVDITLMFKGSRTFIKEYIVKSKVPLRNAYEAIKEILRLEIRYAEFLLKNDSEKGMFDDTRLKIDALRPYSVLHTRNIKGHDDLIRFEFGEEGQEYYFQFIRQNRKPFLDWAVRPAISGADPRVKIFGEVATLHSVNYENGGKIIIIDDEQALRSGGNDADFFIIRGHSIFLLPSTAWDPDEDELTYTKSGWLAQTMNPLNEAYYYTTTSGDQSFQDRGTTVTDGEFTDSHTVRFDAVHHWKNEYHYTCADCDSCKKGGNIPRKGKRISLDELFHSKNLESTLETTSSSQTGEGRTNEETYDKEKKEIINGELEEMDLVSFYLEMISSFGSIKIHDITIYPTLDERKVVTNNTINSMRNFVNIELNETTYYIKELDNLELLAEEYAITSQTLVDLRSAFNKFLRGDSEIEGLKRLNSSLQTIQKQLDTAFDDASVNAVFDEAKIKHSNLNKTINVFFNWDS